MEKNEFFLDIETTGLDPQDSEVTAIGIAAATPGPDIIWDRKNGESEEHIIKRFSEWLERKIRLTKNRMNVSLIGYNIDNFDLPFLEVRGWKYNMDLNKLFTLFTVDLIEFLQRGRLKYVSLDTWCKFFEIIKDPNRSDMPLTGKDMPGCWERKEFDKIEAHLRDDLWKLHQLYKKMYEVGIFKK